MPFRNLETLESWLDEFRQLGYPTAGVMRVMVQDGDGGIDTGLVGVRLEHGSASVYIQPTTQRGSHWVATFEPRDNAVDLDASQLRFVSSELTTVAALCEFLEQKALAHVGTDPA